MELPTFLWTIFGFCVWFLIGCAVLAAVDDERRLFNWARSAPCLNGTSYVLIVVCWPVVAALWYWRT